MADLSEVWAEALPSVKQGVTGVGVWTALNAAKPIVVENGILVLGLPNEMTELSGHLKMAQTKRLIEMTMASLLNEPVTSRVIEGTSISDWEVEKRRDSEKARLNQQAMDKMRLELQSRSNWESIYEVLGRKFAAVPNKSLPQNRARFYDEAIALLAGARKDQTNYDDMGERNFARCLERLAHYSEVPSTIVAQDVLRQAGEL